MLLYIGLSNLESINLSFTVVTDTGLMKLSGLTSLRTLNLDARHVTDAGLSALTSKSFLCFSLQSINRDCQQVSYLPLYDAVRGSSRLKNILFLSVLALGLTGLTHLDLFGARITDSGTNHLRSKFLMISIHFYP